MNNDRRKKVAAALGLVEEAIAILDEIAGDERDAYDNMPEGLKASERGEACSSAADALESARDSVQSAVDELGGIE